MSADQGNSNSSNPNPPVIAGALTYPARSDENMQRVPVQPRPPRNLQGLIRFAMEATKAEDAPGNSELGPMDAERRKFLEEALKSLTVDIAQVLQSAIKILTDTDKMKGIQLGQPIPDDVKSAFSNLLEFIDDIDVANDFYKMGGFAIFPICYSSENDEIRALASSVLAELCQNNPFCQARALECGLLNILLNLIQSERGNALAKCLYAVSCATREFTPAVRELVSQGGCAALAQLVAAPEPAARTKAAFLVQYLARNHPDARAQFTDLNVVRTICDQIKSGRDDTTEHLLGTIIALLGDSNQTVIEQCRQNSTDLRNVLESHLKHPDLETDRFIEEREYCQQILNMVFHDCPQTSADNMNEEVADR